MDFFSSMNISASALKAERTRMNIISSNLANANTTRTAEGGPYRRKDAVFTALPAEKTFGAALQNAAQKVEVTQIVEDQNPPRLKHEPMHPDANAAGYVAYPNVNTLEEMVDLMTATRSYEANMVASQASKSMALKTLDILR